MKHVFFSPLLSPSPLKSLTHPSRDLISIDVPFSWLHIINTLKHTLIFLSNILHYKYFTKRKAKQILWMSHLHLLSKPQHLCCQRTKRMKEELATQDRVHIQNTQHVSEKIIMSLNWEKYLLFVVKWKNGCSFFPNVSIHIKISL